MKPRLLSTVRLSLTLASAIAALLAAPSAQATDFFWDGVNGNWSAIADWSTTAAGTTSPGAIPNSATTADLFFNITSKNAASSFISNGGGARNALSLTFNSSGTTDMRAGGTSGAASTLTIGAGGITLGASSGNVTLGVTPASYGTLTVALGADQTWTNNNAASTLTVNGAVTGVGRQLTKSGPGLIRLNGVNTYSGGTIIGEGTLAFTTANTLTGGLTFGTTAGSATTGDLDLSTASTSFGAAFLVRTNSATANTISIGSSKTLQLNGAVTVGYNSAANSTTNLDVTGLGTLSIGTNLVATNANVQIGNGATTGISNAAMMDLSGLSTFYSNLGTGTFRVGSPTNSGGSSAAGSTVILAADSTINAAAVVMGSPDGGVTQSIKLGSGTNVFNVGTLNVGGNTAADGRSSGSLTFNGATGTLKIRSQADPVAGRATLNVASMAMNTGTGQTATLFDTTSHSADLLFGTMTIGSRTLGGGTTTGEFKFDTGTLDGNDLIAGNRGSSASGSVTTTGIVSLGGGTVTLNNTTGPIQLGVNSTATGTASGILNISGGSVTVDANGGNSIRLGDASVTGGTATGTLNLTGGTLTVAGDIIRGATTGSSSATLKISGGTLDMGGNAIGATGTGAVTLTAESGELKNVATINGNGGLTKTTAGTLTLSGTNTYTGATTVSGGSLVINGAVASTSVVVNGSLGGSGVMENATLSGTGSINPGNSPGVMTAAATNPTGGLDYNFEFSAANGLPEWDTPAASVNDVLRLTDATPFTAALGGTNTVTIYLNVGSLTEGDVFTGGFYTDNNAAFLSSISSGLFQYFLANAGGATTYGGNTYSAYSGPLGFELGTVSQSADFGAGAVAGYTTQFTVVPEPNVAALLGGLGALLLLRRR